MLKSNCLQCNKLIYVREAEIKRGNGKFCSLKCSSRHYAQNRQKPENNVVCSYCAKPFYKSPSRVKNSKNGIHFCCRTHKDLAQRLGGIPEIQPPHYGNGDGKYRYRKLALRVLGPVCNKCGYNKYSQVLEVHHKDRNRSNNEMSNLEVLCRNCHAEHHLVTCKLN